VEEVILPTILIVANLPSKNCVTLRDAVVRGASDDAVEGIEVAVREPLEATPDDVLAADGVIIGSTENFGYMSGLIKDFFERIYYPCLEKTEALPCALYVKGGLDGQGAKAGMERIITGLRWKPIRDTLVMKGAFQKEFVDRCEELGLQMAAGLESGIY
jgi:multimeric flavodoxin WrbA